MLLPLGKFFTMFHFLENPFSWDSTHTASPNPYDAPDLDADFMNDGCDMGPMVWSYIKSRETARRMDAMQGKLRACIRIFEVPQKPHQYSTRPVFLKFLNVDSSPTTGLPQRKISNLPKLKYMVDRRTILPLAFDTAAGPPK